MDGRKETLYFVAIIALIITIGSCFDNNLFLSNTEGRLKYINLVG